MKQEFNRLEINLSTNYKIPMTFQPKLGTDNRQVINVRTSATASNLNKYYCDSDGLFSKWSSKRQNCKRQNRKRNATVYVKLG